MSPSGKENEEHVLKIYWILNWVKNGEIIVFVSSLCVRRSFVAPLIPACGHPRDGPQPSRQP